MIVDLEKMSPAADCRYDVCVVGAGAAGISLAVELLRLGRRVLLLEAGGLQFEANTHALYRGHSEGLPFAGLEEGRFRGLGGTTTQWGGQILEIDENIFERRPWISKSGWPFPKSELAPFYERALELERLTGALDDPDMIWRGLGLKALHTGPELVSVFSRWCPETNLATIHGAALRKETNLTVILHANVCALELGEDRQSVSAVRCRSLSGREARFQANVFILAPGGIETTRLLLQPMEDGKGAPWNRFDQVGKGFQEHLVCTVATVKPTGLRSPEAYFDYSATGGFRYHLKLKLSPGAQQRLEVLDVCGTVTVTTNGEDKLAQAYETFRLLRMRRFDRLTLKRLAQFFGNLHRLIWHKIPYSRGASRKSAPHRQVLRLTVHCEQSPDAEGTIRLSEDRDQLGLFRAIVDWRTSSLELKSIRAMLETAKAAFEAGGLGELIPDPGVLDDDDALILRLRESSHHIGGARMSDRPEGGVVDRDLKLFGVSNAYVCSSAVFPCAGFANPTHTIIALAARLAAHIGDRKLEAAA